MSTINNIIQINHQENGMSFNLSAARSAIDPGYSLESLQLGSTEVENDLSEFLQPHTVMLRLISGDPVDVGIATGVYPFRLQAADEFMILRMSLESTPKEVSTVQTVADVADSLDGAHFRITDKNGETWGIGVQTSGTFSTGADNQIIVAITTGDTAATIASLIYAALAADTTFTALFDVAYNAAVDNDLITITDRFVGTRTDIADTGATGFTLAVTTQGAAFNQSIFYKSEGSSQIQVGQVPF